MEKKKDKIYFLSQNDNKYKEIKRILNLTKYEVEVYHEHIEEIQSNDIFKIVEDKVIKAFKKISRPIIVEQTGLKLKDLGGFPGGQTQIFWDSLQADKFSQYFSKDPGTGEVTAITVVAYCDGKQIKIYDGEIEGVIVKKPKGERKFQWDCIFQPKGFNQTFSEMGDKKHEISMRKIALEKLRNDLEG